MGEREDSGIRVLFDHRQGRGDAREECFVDWPQLGQEIDPAIAIDVEFGIEADRTEILPAPLVAEEEELPLHADALLEARHGDGIGEGHFV